MTFITRCRGCGRTLYKSFAIHSQSDRTRDWRLSSRGLKSLCYVDFSWWQVSRIATMYEKCDNWLSTTITENTFLDVIRENEILDNAKLLTVGGIYLNGKIRCL